MTSFALKIVALISMFCDHFGAAFYSGQLSYLNLIGRIAFPIFAFQISEGYIHTKNIKKYLIISGVLILFFTLILFTFNIIVFNNIKMELPEKYGIYNFSENLAINELVNQLFLPINITIVLFIAFSIIITIIFLTALNKNENEIINARLYLQKVANGKYSFDIENISESELSNLKKDLYKIVLELKEKSENLTKDRETLSNYITDISHQIRTPLMAITAMIDALIENEKTLDNITRRFVYNISSQLNQINWLVDNLLKMAQLDTKTVKLNKTKINLAQLFKNIENNLSIFLEEKNQTLNFSIDKNIKIYADEKWLTEAFENILKNCVEYSNNNSVIKIECSKNPLYTEIIVSDSGKGINKNEISKIFNRFYKGTNSSGNSFGIGLSLAKSIIESQQGEISVESKENVGTTFTIKIYENE